MNGHIFWIVMIIIVMETSSLMVGVMLNSPVWMGFNSQGVLYCFLPKFFMNSFQDFCLLSWNIRGAVNSTGKRVIKDMIRQWKPDVIILLETHCLFSRVAQFWRGQGFHLKFCQEVVGHSGGIWVLVSDCLQCHITLHDLHRQVVTF